MMDREKKIISIYGGGMRRGDKEMTRNKEMTIGPSGA
jgi:hypothetical protein